MMSLARTLMLSAFALTAEVTTAFAPAGRVLITPGILGSNTPAAKVMSSPDLTTLSMSNTDPDLAVGFVTIAAACTPYVLGTIFPTFFNDGFFLPVYKADDTGRVAEIGWKVRYATLGLALTTLAFYEVYFADKQDAAGILRDSYVLWAIFYAEATRKVCLIQVNRFPKCHF